MPHLYAWEKQYENNLARHTLPKVIEQVNRRREFSQAFGARNATTFLATANEQHQTNVRRTRAVVVALAAVREKLDSDPMYTAQQAANDASVLRSEYKRLRDDLPRIAVKVEDARAIAEDPVDWAEKTFEKFPALADRLPGLPVL